MSQNPVPSTIHNLTDGAIVLPLTYPTPADAKDQKNGRKIVLGARCDALRAQDKDSGFNPPVASLTPAEANTLMQHPAVVALQARNMIEFRYGHVVAPQPIASAFRG